MVIDFVRTASKMNCLMPPVKQWLRAIIVCIQFTKVSLHGSRNQAKCNIWRHLNLNLNAVGFKLGLHYFIELLDCRSLTVVKTHNQLRVLFQLLKYTAVKAT